MVLKDELKQLDRIGWIPVYLVPDSGSLISRLSLVRQLVGAQRFVTVIPQSIIQELDKLKKNDANVREAIRWMETCFQQGTKYVRPQKPAERVDLPDNDQK